MDEKDKKIEALEKELADIKEQNTGFMNDLKERDTEIENLRERAKEQGFNFKKFRDMSKEEKELMTEKEQELARRQDELEEQREKDRQEMENWKKSQRDTMINDAINKYANGNEEIANKIRLNLEKFKDFDTATTRESIQSLTDGAVKMLNEYKADPLRDAHNASGMPGEYKKSDDFTQTSDGQALYNQLFPESAGKDNNQNK